MQVVTMVQLHVKLAAAKEKLLPLWILCLPFTPLFKLTLTFSINGDSQISLVYELAARGAAKLEKTVQS